MRENNNGSIQNMEVAKRYFSVLTKSFEENESFLWKELATGDINKIRERIKGVIRESKGGQKSIVDKFASLGIEFSCDDIRNFLDQLDILNGKDDNSLIDYLKTLFRYDVDKIEKIDIDDFINIIDSSTHAFSLRDKTGRYLYMNSEEAELLGIDDVNSVIGKTDKELIGESEINIADEVIKSLLEQESGLLEKGEGSIEYMQSYYTDDKEVVYLVQKSIVKSKHNDFFLIRSARDVTKLVSEINKLKELTEEIAMQRDKFEQVAGDRIKLIEGKEKLVSELKKLLEQRNKMFSVVAHDIKNPLGAILGYSSLLVDEFKRLKIEDGEDKNDFQLALSSMKDAAGNLSSLIFDLLEWSRAVSGAIEIKKEKFDFGEVALDVLKSLKHMAASKNISLVSDGDIFIYADINQIKFIIRNLVSNAIKFTDVGGKVNIDMKEDNEYSYITIRDNGIGISEENIKTLFNNVKSTNGTNGERGTGLGLMTIYEYVKFHGGEINVESKVGEGSVFVVKLPKDRK